MKILNYHAYYEAFKVGVVDKEKTAVGKLLFHPLFASEELCDKNGNPYEINSTNGPNWAGGKKNIPKDIRKAVNDGYYRDEVIEYFRCDVKNALADQILLQEMLMAMINLVNSAYLTDNRKKQLTELYSEGKWWDFLAETFMASLLGDNTKTETEPDPVDKNTDEALEDFNKIVRSKYVKPRSMAIPERIAVDELPYVGALYDAYSVTTGKEIDSPDDLNSVHLRKHFERQRKNYYLAETIHRAIRDTIRRGEDDGFNTLKDEIEAGIEETEDQLYETPVKKIDAVMDKAGLVPISHNTDLILLGWIAAGEKKGVCHMLVNDGRLKWVEDEDSE